MKRLDPSETGCGLRMLWRLKERQQRWLAEERGTIFKDWGGKLRIALAFPNRYSVGMSNLGFHSVYETLNRHDRVVCERVFYPEPEDLPVLTQRAGHLFSTESQRPVREFDLLAFSIPFENDFANAVQMLNLGGIAPRSEERASSDPWVAAGGIAVSMNPEPLAPFMDFVFVGEAESLIPDFLEFWRENRDRGVSRREVLRMLAREVRSIYVPSLYRVSYHRSGALEAVEPLPGSGAPARVAYRRADLNGNAPSQTCILTPNTEFSRVQLVEIGRGCGRGCRFCAAGFMYRPMRHHKAERLLPAIENRFPENSRVGLISAAVTDHPDLDPVCRGLVSAGKLLSFSSLRADGITPEIVSALQASQHRAVAIAVEAGSERLRCVINKNLSLEDVYRAARLLTDAGILSLKLYFMIGLPTETRQDLEAIVDVAKGVKHQVLKTSRGHKKLGAITLSVNSLVPKPFTPFQWAGFAGIQELKDRAKWIKTALRKVPNLRVHFDVPKWAYVQALLARGDRRCAMFLEKVAMDGLGWPQAMRTAPLNPDFWVLRERDGEESFPWEIVDLGVSRSFLREEYLSALKGQQGQPCLPGEGCRRCGVCETG